VLGRLVQGCFAISCRLAAFLGRQEHASDPIAAAWEGRRATSRFVGLAAAITILVGGIGCAGPTRLAGSPPPVPRDAFRYQPIRRRSPSEIPVRTVTKPPLVLPRVPSLPEHDVSWDVRGWQRPWRWIVVHHSATQRGSAAAFDDWHRNGRHWDELGYHFGIGNGTGSGNGETEVGSRWPKQKHGAHCKVGDDETYNNFGVGICLVGDFMKSRPTDAQMASLARLVDYLAARYGIDGSHIIGHGDVDDTRCPGRYFSMDDLMSRLAQQRAARGEAPGRR